MMDVLTLKITIPDREKEYDIHIDCGLDNTITKVLSESMHSSFFVVTDENVHSYYGERIKAMLDSIGRPYRIYCMPAGEKEKNISRLLSILEACLTAEMDRKSAMIAWGGGVVGDLTGFAASVYKRGISYYQIPTTLLAQVDSSVGGKVGINHQGYKNTVGAFYHPEGVFIDPDYLVTLTERDYRSGLAEVLKYSFILDHGLYDYLLAKCVEITKRDPESLKRIAAVCCELKRDVVTLDEKDTGIRGILNFGHTIGHGIEYALGPETVNHGEAVAIGMLVEATIAFKEKKISLDELKTVEYLLAKYGFTKPAEEYPVADIILGMRQDKKNQNDNTGIVYLKEIGEAENGWISKKKVADYVYDYFTMGENAEKGLPDS